jgi:lysozyme
MDISQRGLALIKDYEGYSATAYLCPEGVPTIGWGSTRWSPNRAVKMGDTCSKEQAEKILLDEVRRIEDAIDDSVHVKLTQGEFDCLCSWGFNVGTGWITGKGHQQATLIKYLNKGQYSKVPSELLKFKRGANTGNAIGGLLNRRKREISELWFADYVEYSEEAATPVAVPKTDPTIAPMPQAVEPEQGSVKDAVKESWTIKGAIVAGISYVTQQIIASYDTIFGVAKEAGPEILALKTTIAPFDPLMKLAQGGLALLVVTGIVIVVVRRLQAAVQGKEG